MRLAPAADLRQIQEHALAQVRCQCRPPPAPLLPPLRPHSLRTAQRAAERPLTRLPYYDSSRLALAAAAGSGVRAPPPLYLQVRQKSIVVQVGPDSPRVDVPYHQQGDLDMYAPGHLESRYALREHPAVVEAIELFWGCLDLPKDAADCVAKEGYLDLSVKLQQVLSPPPLQTRRRGQMERRGAGWIRSSVSVPCSADAT